MTRMECTREREIVKALLSPTPADIGDDLRAHAETCDVCRDVAAVAAALCDERHELLRDVHVPAAGQVWWRSALRAHAEAAHAARRPMIWLQGIAGACAAGLVAALVTMTWPSMADSAGAVTALLFTLRPDVAPLVEALRPALPLAVAALVCLVVAPIVVYFALADD